MLMTASQRGVYIDLLALQWSTGGFTMEQSKIAVRGATEEDIERVVLMKFEIDPGSGMYKNARLEFERDKQASRSNIASHNGKLGGRPPTRGNGFAYAMRRDTDNAIKLGISKNPRNRRSQIQSRKGFQVELLKEWQCHDMGILESVLHGFFAEKRLDGEWFNITEDDLGSPQLADAIASVNAIGNDIGNDIPCNAIANSNPQKKLSDSDSDSVLINKKIKETASQFDIPKSLDTPEFRQVWEDYKTWYLANSETKLDPIKERHQLYEIASYGVEKAIADIRFTIRCSSKPGAIWDSQREYGKSGSAAPKKRRSIEEMVEEHKNARK